MVGAGVGEGVEARCGECLGDEPIAEYRHSLWRGQLGLIQGLRVG